MIAPRHHSDCMDWSVGGKRSDVNSANGRPGNAAKRRKWTQWTLPEPAGAEDTTFVHFVCYVHSVHLAAVAPSPFRLIRRPSTR